MTLIGTENEIEPALVPVAVTVYMPGGVDEVLLTVSTRLSELPGDNSTDV